MENEEPITKDQIAEISFTIISQEDSCLPDDIIVDILLRLPVESLLKFRSVSKSWLSLLSSPHFIKAQIDFSAKDCKNVNLRLAIIASASGLAKICSVYSLTSELNSSINVAKLDYPLKAPLGSGKLLGSCNGLICSTAVSFKLMLWNPCTGKYKEFPDTFVHTAVSCYIRHGFGYDASTYDYKVVKIFSFPKRDGKHVNTVKVYSSRANSWAVIQGFNSGYINGLLGVFVNGTLHWEVWNPKSRASWEIMTLDLATETYGIMGLPSCGYGNFSWALSVLGGRLVACCNYYPDRTDMWVMKEYGMENSWTKLVSVLSPLGRRGHISPLFMSEKEVLVKLGTDLSVYNSRNASCQPMEIHAPGGHRQLQAVTYIESLASPHVCDK